MRTHLEQNWPNNMGCFARSDELNKIGTAWDFLQEALKR
jgi:hypothetical protein